LTGLKEWLNKYTNYVIGGAVAVVLIIGIAAYSAQQRTRQFEQGWTDHQAAIDDYIKASGSVGRGANATIPPNQQEMDQAFNNMQQVADTYADDEELVVRSLLWIGNQSLRQLATARSGSSDPSALRLIDHAEKAYQRVVNEFANRPLDVAVARFGLAAIAEERGQFGQAKGIYEELSRLEGADVLPMVNLAKVKLKEVDRYAEPVTFASPPPPPTTQPFSKLIIPPAPTSPTTAPATTPTTAPAAQSAKPAGPGVPTTQPVKP